MTWKTDEEADSLVDLHVEQGPLRFIARAAGPGKATWEYTVDTGHLNPTGVLHGGVLMALLDTRMGHAVAELVVREKRFNAAAQMSTNFLAPVRSGLVRAEAKVIKIGKRLAVVEAQATDTAGNTIALATATHALLP